MVLLGSASVATPLLAQPCDPGNANSTAYIQRNDDLRCEGILANPASRTKLELVSFTAGRWPQTTRANATLELQIPGPPDQTPTLRILSRANQYYQLDPLELAYGNGYHQFQWSNQVLKTEGIGLGSLEALATIRPGSQPIYQPVILDQTTGTYTFVLYSPNRAKINTFKIFRGNRPILYQFRHSFQPAGPLTFTWNARSAQAGRYRLEVEAEIEQANGLPEPDSLVISFDHDPDWLQ
jgi:hypothetical protein